MRRPRADAPTRSVRVAQVILMGLLTATACSDQAPAILHIGDASPHFQLPTLGGGELDSRSLAGHPVILSFWATWCQPCFAEIPVLKSLDADPRVAVVAIALDQEGETSVRPFAEHQQMKYTIALGNEEVFQRFSGFSIPYTLVLDAQGRVVNIYRGPVSEASLIEDVEGMVGT